MSQPLSDYLREQADQNRPLSKGAGTRTILIVVQGELVSITDTGEAIKFLEHDGREVYQVKLTEVRKMGLTQTLTAERPVEYG